jgi:hypothetical protein
MDLGDRTKEYDALATKRKEHFPVTLGSGPIKLLGKPTSKGVRLSRYSICSKVSKNPQKLSDNFALDKAHSLMLLWVAVLRLSSPSDGGEGWRELQRRPTKELSYERYFDTISIINHLAEHVVVGDMNAHHLALGGLCTKIDSEAEITLEMADEYNHKGGHGDLGTQEAARGRPNRA